MMEQVGIFFIRSDERVVVFENGLRLLIGGVEDGETAEQAAVRVLANLAPCPVAGYPVFVITEKMKGDNIHLYAVRATDTFGLKHVEAEGFIEQMASNRLKEKSA